MCPSDAFQTCCRQVFLCSRLLKERPVSLSGDLVLQPSRRFGHYAVRFSIGDGQSRHFSRASIWISTMSDKSNAQMQISLDSWIPPRTSNCPCSTIVGTMAKALGYISSNYEDRPTPSDHLTSTIGRAISDLGDLRGSQRIGECDRSNQHLPCSVMSATRFELHEL